MVEVEKAVMVGEVTMFEDKYVLSLDSYSLLKGRAKIQAFWNFKFWRNLKNWELFRGILKWRVRDLRWRWRWF